jgi:hypothetical protein
MISPSFNLPFRPKFHIFRRLERKPRVTCCVAVLCDAGASLILISDRMFATWGIQSELDINKCRVLSSHWWVQFAGDDISPIFDILDWTREKLSKHCSQSSCPLDSIPVDWVVESLKKSYERKRLSAAEALYLTPIGWDVEKFKHQGKEKLPDYLDIKSKVASHSLGVDFLVGGFSGGQGYIFSVGPAHQGVTDTRHDIPGFHSIGSGSHGANYMLWYREVTYNMQARRALYYAMEAKLFGELDGGVGEGTDVFVATPDGRLKQLNEDETVEKKLVKIWTKLRPRWISRESAEILNGISEMEGFPQIELDDDGKPFPPKRQKKSNVE